MARILKKVMVVDGGACG